MREERFVYVWARKYNERESKWEERIYERESKWERKVYLRECVNERGKDIW